MREFGFGLALNITKPQNSSPIYLAKMGQKTKSIQEGRIGTSQPSFGSKLEFNSD